MIDFLKVVGYWGGGFVIGLVISSMTDNLLISIPVIMFLCVFFAIFSDYLINKNHKIHENKRNNSELH